LGRPAARPTCRRASAIACAGGERPAPPRICRGSNPARPRRIPVASATTPANPPVGPRLRPTSTAAFISRDPPRASGVSAPWTDVSDPHRCLRRGGRFISWVDMARMVMAGDNKARYPPASRPYRDDRRKRPLPCDACPVQKNCGISGRETPARGRRQSAEVDFARRPGTRIQRRFL
jgi:hypothetical protein